ncbi:MAG: hypothetical protein AAF372_00445 [Pseudomonadota bacterium]
MQAIITIIILSITILLIGCQPSEESQISEMTVEEMDKVYSDALASPKEFQQEIKQTCAQFNSLLFEVAETIRMGARIWNAGGQPITIRLYEGVAYRVLYEIDDSCPKLTAAFKSGLRRAFSADTIDSQGRALRETLDLIMGGPPVKPPGASQ